MKSLSVLLLTMALTLVVQARQSSVTITLVRWPFT